MLVSAGNGKYRIKSHTTGKVYPKTYSKKAGEHRIKQMEYFKHMKGRYEGR